MPGLFTRSIYALQQFIKHKNKLKIYLNTTELSSRHITKIMPDILEKFTINVLVLDYDGVLAPHGKNAINDEILKWIKEVCAHSNIQAVYVLSNKPSHDRQGYLKEVLPSVKFIWPTRKKPYPDGLNVISQQENVAPTNMMIVDDRLMTGILAGVIFGCRAMYVEHPLIDWRNWISEAWFCTLRCFERLCLRIL